jgi:hypothetical protein
MKKQLNDILKYSVLTFSFMGICAVASAETPKFHQYYGVADWQELVPNVQAEYQRYRQQVLQDSSLSDVLKVKNIGEKYDEIRHSLTYNRKSVYASFSEQHHVSNSAVKQGIWGVAKAEPECLSPQKEELYTIAEWVRGAYQDSPPPSLVPSDILKTGIVVDSQQLMKNEGKTVCTAALKQKNKGRSIAYSEASFRILPQHINHIVNAEVSYMMQQITQSKDHS